MFKAANPTRPRMKYFLRSWLRVVVHIFIKGPTSSQDPSFPDFIYVEPFQQSTCRWGCPVGPCVDCWHHVVEFSKVWKTFVLRVIISQYYYRYSVPTTDQWATLVAEVLTAAYTTDQWATLVAEVLTAKLAVGNSNPYWTTSRQCALCGQWATLVVRGKHLARVTR